MAVLSSSEAEYIALAELVKECMYLTQAQQFTSPSMILRKTNEALHWPPTR